MLPCAAARGSDGDHHWGSWATWRSLTFKRKPERKARHEASSQEERGSVGRAHRGHDVRAGALRDSRIEQPGTGSGCRGLRGPAASHQSERHPGRHRLKAGKALLGCSDGQRSGGRLGGRLPRYRHPGCTLGSRRRDAGVPAGDVAVRARSRRSARLPSPSSSDRVGPAGPGSPRPNCCHCRRSRSSTPSSCRTS